MSKDTQQNKWVEERARKLCVEEVGLHSEIGFFIPQIKAALTSALQEGAKEKCIEVQEQSFDAGKKEGLLEGAKMERERIRTALLDTDKNKGKNSFTGEYDDVVVFGQAFSTILAPTEEKKCCQIGGVCVWQMRKNGEPRFCPCECHAPPEESKTEGCCESCAGYEVQTDTIAIGHIPMKRRCDGTCPCHQPHK